MIIELATVKHLNLLAESQVLAESVNVFFVLAAKECPFEELVGTDETGRVSWVSLALDDTIEDLEYLRAHFPSLGYSELEEEHGDIAVDLVSLAGVLTMVKRQS